MTSRATILGLWIAGTLCLTLVLTEEDRVKYDIDLDFDSDETEVQFEYGESEHNLEKRSPYRRRKNRWGNVDYDDYYDPGVFNPVPYADRRNSFIKPRNLLGILAFAIPALLGVGGLFGLGITALAQNNGNDTTNIINFNPNITYRGDNITFTVTDTDTITNTNDQTQTANAINTINNNDMNTVNTGVNPINTNAGGESKHDLISFNFKSLSFFSQMMRQLMGQL